MNTKHPKHVPLPTKAQVLEFILESPGKVGKREIARAFNLSAEQRPVLREIMKSLEQDGAIQRGHNRRVHKPGLLPEVTVLEVTGTDPEGDLLARPMNWHPEDHPATKDLPPPRITVLPVRKGLPAVGVGDKVLARLQPTGDHRYDARVIKRLASAPSRVLGVLDTGVNGLLLRPTDKRDRQDYLIAKGDAGNAEPGDLVECELLPGRRFGLRQAQVVDNLGSMGNPKAVSLIAIHSLGIPYQFTQEALEQAESAEAAPMGKRVDLRKIPLVTIDGSDARDFDDAVWAEPDGQGGWHCLVAIADVAHYVRTDDALDRTAAERGNSVYFPDRVVPMLPEKLSNGWCSLRPNEDRPCLAVHFWIDGNGHKYKHEFLRGMMRSAARLTYEQAQAAIEGTTDETTGPLLETVIKPLDGAYRALRNARDQRGALEIHLPERRVMIGENGEVLGIVPRPSLEAHKLIEEFMVTANVCAAETLEGVHQPCMYRVHDEPSLERVDALREFLQSMDLTIAQGALRAQNFNAILAKVKDTANEHLVNQVVLRTQAQAIYSPENRGHFGLGLHRYAHFTSPIRRYADLLVHRALIRGLGLGEGGLTDNQAADFGDIAEQICLTERRAATAERDVIDRYTTLYLADKVGATFSARVVGATRFGLFVELDDTGANGLVPISSLPDDFYVHDEAKHALIGKKTRREYQVGLRVVVVLRQADAVTGGMLFELMEEARAGKSAATRPRLGTPLDLVIEDEEKEKEREKKRKKFGPVEVAEGPRKHFTPLRVGGLKSKGFVKNSGKKVERAGKKRVVRFEPGTTGRRKKDDEGVVD